MKRCAPSCGAAEVGYKGPSQRGHSQRGNCNVGLVKKIIAAYHSEDIHSPVFDFRCHAGDAVAATGQRSRRFGTDGRIWSPQVGEETVVNVHVSVETETETVFSVQQASYVDFPKELW